MDENKNLDPQEVIEEVKSEQAETKAEATVVETVENEETPAEEAPTEEAPAEEAAPVEEAAPAEEVAAPVEEAPAEDVPSDLPAEEEVAPAAEEAPAEPEPEAKEHPAPRTKEEVIERLRQIVAEAETVARQELEHLKQVYYHIHNAEATAAREAFIAAGGNADDFQPAPDPLEESFKAEMERVREVRAKEAASLEEEKQRNLKRKLEIIELVKQYAESPETADKNFEQLKKLQAEWREIKSVPAENATELWKNYQHYIELFYDQLHLNHEARMYDFKKNLEKKLQLCESAEKLAEMEDPIAAFRQLQALHQDFRETGPVEKEKREEVWERFKAASTVINKRHQAYFEDMKAQEEENLQRKTALCEQVEGLDLDKLKTFADWDKMTKQVLAWQAEWRTVGFTPRKVNAKIFERFRAACDRFFQRKAEYFRSARETHAANLEAKNRLADEAEALKESTDWNSTSQKLIALQKRWKEVGPISHKASEAIWKRFNEACNYFFERKNEATGDQLREEEANLAQKQDVIAQLEAILAEAREDAQQAVHALQDRWNSIGHVPFRKKDKIYKRYREVLDRIYKELNISARRRSVENFRRSVAEKSGNELTRELQRLQNAFEAKRDEIKNYETNLTFFSAKSKGGSSLVEEVERKIARLKEDLAGIAEKIKAAREQEAANEEAEE
ncbi:MAG: DUF349 domain-containing protein [Alloprevotella sp.]|nr:DUF349 domain-containing protein [Alloprevotella sp.]